jgi:excisionase family DNA binding protein
MLVGKRVARTASAATRAIRTRPRPGHPAEAQTHAQTPSPVAIDAASEKGGFGPAGLAVKGDAPSGEATELLTVTQAAQQAGVSRHTITSWIRHGQLPTVLVNRRPRIRPADLAAARAVVHIGAVVPVWRQDRQRVGKRLRALREAAGLSQLQLAVASGVTHELISRLEAGRSAPQAESVRQLADALGIDPRRFVGRDPVGLTMLTVAEAATRLDVPPARVQKWLREGALAGTMVSRQWRVPAVVVAELDRSGRLRGRSRRLDPRYRG